MITLTREEAQQVLDALEDAADHIGCPDDDDAIGVARRTLRARLAQPEPEPEHVATIGNWGKVMWREGVYPQFNDKLYTAPPQREWQGLTDEEMSAAMDYWSDPVRSAYGGAHSADGEYVGMIDTWRYIEAKLKEKNGG
jgi:hypothetical protein